MISKKWRAILLIIPLAFFSFNVFANNLVAVGYDEDNHLTHPLILISKDDGLIKCHL